MDLQALQATVRDFAAARGWRPFHTPKNLAMALMVEAAELLEIFQWLTPEESARAADDPGLKQHIGEEIADVLIYLVQLADRTRVDIGAAVHDKLQRNARKYPATNGALEVSRVAAPEAPEPPSPPDADTHVLLDYENVQPADADVRALVPQASKLWVFHGPHQKQVGERFGSFGKNLTAVAISKTGKNALDFHLSFYMGYIAARNPDARFVVLANDRGYEPMIEHAKDLGFDVRALGVNRPAKGRGRRAAAAALPVPDAPTQVKPAARKPRSKPAAKVAAPSRETAAPRAEPAPVVATKAPTRKRVSTPRPAARQVPVTHPPTVTPAKAPTKSLTKAPTKAAKKPSTSAAVAQKIEQGLHKLGPKRPTRLARLRGVLKSLLGAAASDDAVDAALVRLKARAVVAVDDGGHVSYPGQG